MNKDIDSAIEQTHRIMDVAKNDLGFTGRDNRKKRAGFKAPIRAFFPALFPHWRPGVVYVVFAAQQYF